MSSHHPHDPPHRARERAAGTIDAVLQGSLAPPGRRRLPPLVRRDVAEAVEHDLRTLRSALLDPDVVIAPDAARRLEAFLHDGAASPLYQADRRRAASAAGTLTRLIAPTGAHPSRRSLI